MSDAPLEGLSPVKRALIEIRDLRAKLQESERIRTDPIALVGIGLRLPGGIATPEAFWQLLDEGRSAITEVPSDRWAIEEFFDPDPDEPGKMSTRFGGFLQDVDRFDARFFGITPREAASMDPQQRLLLEVSWEALERAGQAPDGLAGQPVGVFVGLSSTDYLTTELKFGEARDIDAYLATGGHPSVASGRISYALGLQGPSLTIDTACSSSLSAVHVAAQSLRLGECRVALAAGVSLILLPELNINFSKAHMMAGDGLCKTFDQRADGYVRSEGCAVVVLKRLSDALEAGDPVLAVIRGSALNQDGRSSGLTVPNGPAQEAVVRDALARAGVSPSAVSYVEAHGTGTSLGDPIELRALGNAFSGRSADDGPLHVGSVKTNLGHLEAAAGITSLIKVVLALQHDRIPPHLNVERLSEHVPWKDLPIVVPTTAVPWDRRPGRPRIAGVSSFGFSGTNAHVVVEEAPAEAPAGVARPAERPAHLLPISGRTESALRDAARQLAKHMGAVSGSLADVCHTAGAGRAHFAERAALTAATIPEAVERLDAIADGREAPHVLRGRCRPGARADVAFLFAGLGSQHVGMGRELFATQPVFRDAILRCQSLLRDHLDRPLVDVLYPASGQDSPLNETAYAQPALFAVEYALAEMWRAWGVTPSYVLGHSLGEDVAACVAGVFPLEQGLDMVARRARLMQDRVAPGAMAAVFGPESRVLEILAAYGAGVTLAAINGPQQVVISGPAADVRGAVTACEAAGLKVRLIAASQACHSPAMDPVLDDVERIVDAMTLAAPGVSLVSNVTGRLASTRELTSPAYWRRHIRETVRFSDGLETLRGEGVRIFLEIGPNGTLTGMGCRCLEGGDVVWLQSLKRESGNWEQVLAAAGALYVNGLDVLWAEVEPGRKVSLPTYPFQRERHWSDAVPVRRAVHHAVMPVPVLTDPAAWLYGLAWKPVPAVDAPESALEGSRWLIVADGTGVGDAAVRRLGEAGAQVQRLDPGDDVAAAIARSPDAPGPLRVLHLAAIEGADAATLTTPGLADVQRRGLGSLLRCVQALATAPGGALLHVVTRGALPVGPRAVAVEQAPAAALCRAISAEHPELSCTHLDLDPDGDGASAADSLVDALRRPIAGEMSIAVRGRERVVPRLTRHTSAPGAGPPLRADGTYLVTGGTGALGLEVARSLVERGARRLVLVSRRGASDASAGVIAGLIQAGARIDVAQGDVSDPEFVDALVARLAASPAPLMGLVHAAGVLDDGVMARQTWERFEAVLAPKVAGAWNLHRATAGLPLDFFVMFSSAASVLGSAGQANYVAANGFLDALAYHRRAAGLAATSLDWSAWEGAGMASTRGDRDVRRHETRGIGCIPVQSGLALLGALSAGDAPPQLLVMPADWAAYRRSFRGAIPSIVADLFPLELAAETEAIPRLAELTTAERLDWLSGQAREQIVAVLGLDPSEQFDPRQGLQDLGMDSLMALELRNRLQRTLGRALPPTVAFDHPSLDALTTFLAREFAEVVADSAPAASARGETRAVDADPIAVIGLGCRMPGGADSPEALWELLHNGVDAITEVPPDRWDIDAFHDPDPAAPGKMVSRWGGFVHDVDRFDPQFFGVAPREAASMDPQQRLLLEVSWEAIEHAGQPADRLHGSRTGVFVGISTSDYAQLQMRSVNARDLEAHFGTGNAISVAAGRLAYTLGLQGPTLAVDTACSSSMVAIHLACQSLRRGECSMALAGGVNLILAPENNVILSRARMLSPDGRCRTFDASANGYVRSDGCGVVVLKRLSDAVAAGDRVLAVIRGTAVNQDGRSGGLTVPNGPAQEWLIREALAVGGLTPADVDYVEAHGTGTSLGDPIEVRALANVFGADRPVNRPLRIGSVKTNLGHLESAAGVAGLIKVVLSLQHEEIPPHLHLREVNPLIALDAIPAEIPTTPVPWRRGSRPRRAGVSSFGFSGTNAHAVIEEAPLRAPAPAADERPRHVLPISARSPAALADLASAYGRLLASPPGSIADVCHSAGTGRAHLPYRLAVAGANAAELHAALAARVPDVAQVEAAAARPKVAFLFTGQGAQYAGMARGLFEREPAFRAALERCDAWLRGALDQPLLDVLFSPAHAALLDQTAFTQPALVAIELALAELWRSWGVEPAAVIGHSVGEYAAAVVAGVMAPEAALRLVATRGRLMQALPAGGAMAAIFAGERRVREAIAAAPVVSIAALNAPDNVVISGPGADVAAIAARLTAEGVEVRPLVVSHAFHSALVDPMLDVFEQAAAGLEVHAPVVPMASNLTGRFVDAGAPCDGQYWRAHARGIVRFAEGLQAIVEAGCTAFLEVGPHPTLIGLARRVHDAGGVRWLPSLSRGRDDTQQVLESLAGLYEAGADIAWAAVEPGAGGGRVDLPTYPFQRARHWIEARAPRRSEPAARAGSHPLLGRRIHSRALTDVVFESEISIEAHPWLAHHRVQGATLAPAALHVELALAAAGNEAAGLEGLTIHEPLVIPETEPRLLQVVRAADSDAFEIVTAATPVDGQPPQWTRHASGRMTVGPIPPPGPTLPLDVVRARLTEEIDADGVYARLGASGLEMGPAFRAIRHVWRRDGEALGEVALEEAVVTGASAFRLHPALFDACCHVTAAAFPASLSETPYLLIGIDRIDVVSATGHRVWAHAEVDGPPAASPEVVTARLSLHDADGRALVTVSGLQFKKVHGRPAASAEWTSEWVHELAWREKPRGDANGGRALASAELPDVAAGVQAEVPSLVALHGLDAYGAAQRALESLATAYACRALRDLGVLLAPGDRFTFEDVVGAAGGRDAHRRLLRAMLGMLEADGGLTRNGDTWTMVRDVSPGDPHALRDALLRDSPACQSETILTARCGDGLAGVLRGDEDPLSLLFPAGSLDTAERVYQDSPGARLFNGLVTRAVRSLVGVASGRPLRILEVGAGTGGTTASILPLLPADTEYVFTDVSNHFLQRAAGKFEQYPFVQYRLLDIEHDPVAQGLAASQFDLVVAVNVLHATREMGRTLEHVRRLLAPGGLLLVGEATVPRRWLDITFGLTDGWWRFTDTDLRPSHPLLSRAGWRALLAASGFADACLLPDVADDRDALAGQALILTRSPAVAPAASRETSGTWLILADAGGVGDAVARRLRARGVSVRTARPPGAGDARPTDITLDSADPAALSGALASAADLAGVLHLWSLDIPSLDQATPGSLEHAGLVGSGSLLQVVQAMTRLGRPVPIWIATADALAVGADDGAAGAVQSPVWGLGRVIALEHPECWGGIIDLESGDSEACAAHLVAEMLAPDGEDQIAIRGAARRVARIVRTGRVRTAPVRLRADRSYLVTGGTGGLGLQVGRWLVERGARHLVLLSRTPVLDLDEAPAGSNDARVAAALRSIRAPGATIVTVAASVADHSAMADVIGRFGREWPPLGGVVHGAADISSGRLRSLSTDTLLASLRPKVTGTQVLCALVAPLDPDFVVLFSSTTGLLGSMDLGAYAAANVFLDSYAAAARRQGLPVTSLTWGAWDRMRDDGDGRHEAVVKGGLRQMPSSLALDALGRLLAPVPAQVIVADADWPTLKAVYEARRRRPLFDEVAAASAARRPPGSPARDRDLRARLDAARAVDRPGVLLAHVREQAAQVLGLAPPQVDLKQGLFDMGMDSLMSVDLKSRLEVSVGQPLPTTLTFNYPSVSAIAEYLATQLLRTVVPAPETSTADPTPARAAQPTPTDDDLSEDELASLLAAKLAGMSGR